MILLLLMIVRVWFDMAQVIAVAEDEKKMHRALRRAFGLLRRNFFSLLLALLYASASSRGRCSRLALHMWMHHLNPQSTSRRFSLSQLMILSWIGTRLWQRASEAIWYRNDQANQVPEPAWTPAPAPVFMSVAADPQP